MSDQYTNPAEEQTSVLPEYTEDPEVKKKINSARNWLYVVAIIQTLIGFYELFTTEDETLKWLAFGIDAGLGLTFAVLALYTHKKPFIALVAALVIYSCVVVLLAITDPMTLVKGAIMKAFFFIAMIKGIKTAKEAEALQKLRN